MINGIGFSEILLIGVIVLLCFGSKEIPRFMRETARVMATVRRYLAQARQELETITRSVEGSETRENLSRIKKKELRTASLAKRDAIPAEERAEKSRLIMARLMAVDAYRDATSIMCYCHIDSEVETDALIAAMLAGGKRVVLPYCRLHSRDLGIGEITNLDTDVSVGVYGIREPIEAVRDRFFKSDLRMVICPGVAFDRSGGRLGRGKGFYDTFLRELKGRIPIVGVAFESQLLPESVPFDYHDVPMDMVITEQGIVRHDDPAIAG